MGAKSHPFKKKATFHRRHIHFAFNFVWFVLQPYSHLDFPILQMFRSFILIWLTQQKRGKIRIFLSQQITNQNQLKQFSVKSEIAERQTNDNCSMCLPWNDYNRRLCHSTSPATTVQRSMCCKHCIHRENHCSFCCLRLWQCAIAFFAITFGMLQFLVCCLYRIVVYCVFCIAFRQP